MLVNFGTIKIPYFSLGTSPFIGAGQFGAQGSIWYHRFFNNVDLMADLFSFCCKTTESGGIHVIAYDSIIKAAKKTQKDNDVIITAFLTAEDPRDSLERVKTIDPVVIFIHGSLVDLAVTKANPGFLIPLFNEIRNFGALPGFASHDPLALLNWLPQKEFPEPFAFLLPINKTGWGMDGPINLIQDKLSELKQPVMAMKVLAAGTIPPRDAYSFIVNKGEISAITVGAISKDQIKQNLDIIEELKVS